MSVLHTHLLMITLGLVACVCVSGSVLFSLPNKTWLDASAIRRKRIHGVLAFLAVALAPCIRLFRDPPPTDISLLQQSLLVADIGLLAVLLYALLQVPYKQLIDDKEVKEEAPVIENDIAPEDTLLTATAPAVIPPVEEVEAAKEVEDILDLSHADGMFAENDPSMDDVDLPDNNEWMAERNDSVDLEASHAAPEEIISEPVAEIEPIEELTANDDFIEGEIIEGELDDSSAATDVVPFEPSEIVVSLETIDELNLQLNELQKTHRQLISEQHTGVDDDPLSVSREQLLVSEANVQHAAEAVIRAQHHLLESYKEQADRSKAMAKQAATLARKATQAHNALNDIAKREKQARIKSQEKAKKAVDIARNAVSALAAKEQKDSTISS